MGEPTQGVPRRSDMSRWTLAEHAIRAALVAVEEVGADERLTWAVVALGEAQRYVAAYVDGEPYVDPERQRVQRVHEVVEAMVSAGLLDTNSELDRVRAASRRWWLGQLCSALGIIRLDDPSKASDRAVEVSGLLLRAEAELRKMPPGRPYRVAQALTCLEEVNRLRGLAPVQAAERSVDSEAEAGAYAQDLLGFARSIGLPEPTALQLQLVEVLRAMEQRPVFYGVDMGSAPAVDEAEVGEHD